MAVDEDPGGRGSTGAPVNRKMNVATMNDRLSFNQAMASGQSSTSLKEPDQIHDMRMTHEKIPAPADVSRLSSMGDHLFERLDVRSRKSTIEEDECEESQAASSRRQFENKSQDHKSKSSRARDQDKVEKFVSARGLRQV